MENFNTNPFDRLALKDYRLLAARSKEFTQIRFVLRNASKQSNRVKSILLSGNRGVGKTSFLNLIEAECLTNNLIPVRINLTETNSKNSNEFFWTIFSQIINVLFGFELLGGKGGPLDTAIQKILHADGLNDPANWVFRTPIMRKNYLSNSNATFEFDLLGEDLKLIRKQIKESSDERFNEQTKIFFLVDEAQQIYSNSKVLEDLRYIIQSQDLGIGFVFAGDNSFEASTWENVFGGSYRDFEVISLNYFDNVEAVIEYFTKSLQSIGWSAKEIEETLFYRFKLACRNIYQLTSGNPAWINTIASKMFERCMRGETSILKFDRQAQNDVKHLLENGGQLDRTKLEFIEGLTPKMQKWISRLFNSELHRPKEVYFFSKFILTEELFITKDAFKSFCDKLQQVEILVFPGVDRDKEDANIDILDKRHFAFGVKSDTMKQWLQISSDRKYSFGMSHPGNEFISDINDNFLVEPSNTVIMSDVVTTDREPLRIEDIVKRINQGTFDVNEVPYDMLSAIYQVCKRLRKSKERKVLFCKLTNHKSLNYTVWNVYNYDDQDRIVGLNNSERRIKKYIDNVEQYRNEDHDFSFELFIDTVAEPSLILLQKSIVNCGDKKKIGIILDDKEEDLYEFYIRQSNLESSIETANFFYELFNEGHLLKIRNLNNAAYIFLVQGELDKAAMLLTEAKNQNELYDLENDDSTRALIIYNLAIIDVIKKDYSSAIKNFNSVIRFFNEHEKFSENIGVLHKLKIHENEIDLEEIKDGNSEYSVISCHEFSLENVKLLNQYGCGQATLVET